MTLMINHFLCRTLHHHAKFGYKRLSGSEHMVLKKNPCVIFTPRANLSAQSSLAKSKQRCLHPEELKFEAKSTFANISIEESNEAVSNWILTSCQLHSHLQDNQILPYAKCIFQNFFCSHPIPGHTLIASVHTV